MAREIEDMKAWKPKWMPFSTGRGTRLLLHMLHYHDELPTAIFQMNPRSERWCRHLGSLWQFRHG